MDLERILQIELSERKKRQATLQNIDKELACLVSESQASKSQQYTDLLAKLNNLQIDSSRQIQQLKFKLQREERQHTFELQQLKNSYELLQGKHAACVIEMQRAKQSEKKLQRQNKEMECEINKLRAMIKNQEGLIDDFRESVEEQVQLEKEMLKSIYQEKEGKIKGDFTKALAEMERNYESKLKKMLHQSKVIDYKREVKEFKKYFMGGKENVLSGHSTLQKGRSALKQISSEYSTKAHEKPGPSSQFIK